MVFWNWNFLETWGKCNPALEKLQILILKILHTCLGKIQSISRKKSKFWFCTMLNCWRRLKVSPHQWSLRNGKLVSLLVTFLFLCYSFQDSPRWITSAVGGEPTWCFFIMELEADKPSFDILVMKSQISWSAVWILTDVINLKFFSARLKPNFFLVWFLLRLMQCIYHIHLQVIQFTPSKIWKRKTNDEITQWLRCY